MPEYHKSTVFFFFFELIQHRSNAEFKEDLRHKLLF